MSGPVNRGAAALPDPNATPGATGNDIATPINHALPGQTLVAPNGPQKGPQRGGTTIPQGQAGVAPQTGD